MFGHLISNTVSYLWLVTCTDRPKSIADAKIILTGSDMTIEYGHTSGFICSFMFQSKAVFEAFLANGFHNFF